MNEIIEGYKKAVELLSSASRGLYGQPAVPIGILREAHGTIEGLDTAAIRTAGSRAGGGTETGGVQGWVAEILKYVGGIAGGIVVTELFERATDWFSNRDEAEEVGEASGKAADAIDTAVDESDQGMKEIIAQLIGVIEQLTATLGAIDPAEHPQAFSECVAAGSGLIDQAGEMICGLCADRDEAISQCLNALSDHAKKVCETPIAPLKDAVSGSGVATAAASAGGIVSADASAASSSSSSSGGETNTEDKTTPASVDKTTETQTADECEETKKCETEPAKKPVEKPETPSAADSDSKVKNAEKDTAVAEDCAPESASEKPSAEDDCDEAPANEQKEAPAVEAVCDEAEPCDEEPPAPVEDDKENPEPVAENPSNNGVKTVLGVIGIGALVLGVGAIVSFIEQAIAVPAELPLPPAETPPAAPEPAAPPKMTEAELAAVPEPAPKPIPTASAAAAPAVVAPVINPPSAPAPTPTPVQFNAAPVDTPLIGAAAGAVPNVNVRKSGGW